VIGGELAGGGVAGGDVMGAVGAGALTGVVAGDVAGTVICGTAVRGGSTVLGESFLKSRNEPSPTIAAAATPTVAINPVRGVDGLGVAVTRAVGTAAFGVVGAAGAAGAAGALGDAWRGGSVIGWVAAALAGNGGVMSTDDAS
jgi:hypothetical protein